MFTLTWSRKLAILQFCKIRLLHLNVAHLSKMEPLHRDLLLQHRCQWNDPDKVLRSEVLGSVKDIFLVCSMRQCMSKVWLGATGLCKSKPSWEAHWNQGRVPMFAPPLHWKYKKACAWRGFLKADVRSVSQTILFPQTDVSSFSSGWSKKVPATLLP